MQRIGSRVKGTQRVGSRAQVMHGNAKMTGGGLRKKDLKYNKQGKIVSKKMSQRAKKEKRLQKAGYITKKGQFGVKKMSGGKKEDYIPLLNLNTDYTRLKKLLNKIDNHKLNNLEITHEPYSKKKNIVPDPNPNTMLFKGLNTETSENYFIKIGLWYKQYDDSRNILTEREVYKRLEEKYGDKSNYAKMIGAISFKVRAQTYGIIVLEYKDLDGDEYKDPTESDKDTVKDALKFLEDAGIIHLDIVENIKIIEEKGKKDFFLMDFELAHISESIPKKDDEKLEHKDVYETRDMAELIIDKIKEKSLPPTPEIKRRKLTVSPAHTVFNTSIGSPSKKRRTGSPSNTFKKRLNMSGSPGGTSSTPSPLLLHRTPSPLLLHRTPSPAGTPAAPATPQPSHAPSTPAAPAGTPPPPPLAGGNKKRNYRRKKK